MRQNQLQIGQEAHRNPSRSKLHRNGSKNRKQQMSRNPSVDKKSEPGPLGTGKQNTFLHKCFQQVYLQNIALNQQVERKRKQYAYLVYEHERIKQLNNPIRHGPRQTTNQHTQNHLRQKSSLSSILSVGEQSLMSEKFIPIQQTAFKMDQNEEEPSQFLHHLKTTLKNLNVRDFQRK